MTAMHRLCFGSLAAILICSLLLTTVESARYELALSPASISLSDGVFAPRPQVTPEPGMMFDPTDRLAPPPMSDPPMQVELGHYAYYLSCMVCHGDRGQGLTEEWRSALDPADRNCWQSRCHAANHPPDGFELPHYAPTIIGAGRLAHHQTAADLHEYIQTRMPWQAPGILSDEAYWQLTAFLVDANGIPMGDTVLGPANAGDVLLGLQDVDDNSKNAKRQASNISSLNFILGTLVLMLGALALSSLITRRRSG